MNKYVLKIFIIFALILVLPACNQTSDKKKNSSGIEKIKKTNSVKIGIDSSDYPPFAIKTPGGFVGFDIDMCYDIAKKMGVNADIVQIDFDEILPALDRGEIDLGIATFTITPQRNMNVLFSQPYIVTGQAVLIDKSLKESVLSYRDLNSTQYKVAYVEGNTSEKAVKKLLPDSRFFSVDSADKLTQAVINGDAHAVVADMPFCSTQMAKDGGKNLHFIDQPITFEPIGIAVNKNNHHLLNWISNYIQQIQSDGTYDEFYTKWFRDTDWVKYLK
jgi:polar amino acid transport system substrate-binding protein